MRFYNECTDIAICIKRKNKINENKEIEGSLNLLKRQASKELILLCFHVLKNRMIYFDKLSE